LGIGRRCRGIRAVSRSMFCSTQGSELTSRLPLAQEETPVARPKVAAPETTDPATLLRHLQAYEPVKLALARDLPLTVRKIEKTARGIKQMMAEEEGQETLHKGLGWLHYRSYSLNFLSCQTDSQKPSSLMLPHLHFTSTSPRNLLLRVRICRTIPSFPDSSSSRRV
jgi:U3 small nucleolar RNA-associated protein 3